MKKMNLWMIVLLLVFLSALPAFATESASISFLRDSLTERYGAPFKTATAPFVDDAVPTVTLGIIESDGSIMFMAPIDETTGSITLWYIDNPEESLFHFFWHVTHWDIYDLLSFEYPLQIIFLVQMIVK